MDALAELEDPEEHYETTDGKPYADDFSNLAKDKIEELRSICNAMDERDQWARLIELIRCTLRRYFFIGQQHPTWNSDASCFQVGPSGVTLGDEDENAEEFFEEEFNIYKGYAEVFISVFSQNAAPSRMEPDNPTSGDSVKAAKEAEKYVEVYQKYNPPKVAQLDVGRLMWTDGRIVAVTEYAPDEEKCGVDENGEPLGAEFTKYFGVLETKCPIVGQYKEWPYLKVSRDLDITVAKDENHKYAKDLNGGKSSVPNNEVARMSRIAVDEGVAQVSADTLEYLVTEDMYWLRPAAFRHLDTDKQAFWIGGTQEDENGDKKKIEGIAEKGFRVKWIGQVFLGAKAISMDKQCKVMHTNPGTGNARGSKSDGLIPVQMEFNDAMGMYSEMIHKSIPHKIINASAEALGAITEQFSRYGEWSAMQMENGLPIQQNIFEESQVDVPATFPAWLQNLQGSLPQQLANIQPALFGGNMDDQKTAKAYAQAKDMSLGVMSMVWVPYLQFASGIRWQAARLAGERDQTKIATVIPLKGNKSKTVAINTSVLKRGGYLASPVTDFNFPESHTDKENKWMGLYSTLPQNPLAQLIFQEPDNLVAFNDATGLELVIKGQAARDKQLGEWELMQAEDGPIPDVEATQAQQQQKQQAAQQIVNTVSPGAPAPQVPPVPDVEKSSVPTRLADDHIEEGRTCVRILNDSKTLEMLSSRPEVVHDLELHLIEHLTKAQAGGIVIPPDLAGIVPPPAPPMVPGLPGAAGAVPGATPPGAPTPKVPPAAAIPPNPTTPGGPSATPSA